MVKVEYLFPFNTKDGVCKDIESFNSLLSAHSSISIQEDKIHFSKSKYDYKVSLDEVPNQEYSVFHVTFSFSRTTTKFREMLKAVRKVVGVYIKDEIQIIWDGVGFEWSKELYPRIYQVENNLRKLISKFMLVNLGVGWHKSSVPTDIKSNIKNPNFKGNNSILYEVDFIALSDFLFKPYAIKDTNDLPTVIDKMLDKELTANDKKLIENYIPRNNWNRYFSEIVDIESEQLESKWKKLYGIRNKIAHNKSLKLEDFEIGTELCDILLPIIENSILSLEKIEIPEDERETISLNSIATINNSIQPFINNYQHFVTGIKDTMEINQQYFSSISDSMKPIQTLIESMPINYPIVDNGLTNALASIEDHKNLIISGQTLNSLSDNLINENLFVNVGEKIKDSYEGITLSENLSSFLVENTANKDIDEDETEE